uniref:Uncharacterized protein n=1 Tax=Panagrolaimus sp. JU765 TaxID=591449 RepID=A0AC34RNI8_9BILA
MLRSSSLVFFRSMSSAAKQVISSDKAPQAIGPYSQAIKVGPTIYVSGSLGIDASTGNFVGNDTESQAHQSLKNIGEILKAAGADFSNVVKTTVLLKDMDDFAVVNQVYSKYFKEPYPARAAYAVAKLPKDARVEIEAIAHVSD